MNGLDYAIVGVAVFGAVYGVSRGVLRMVTSATSLVAAVYFASSYHSTAGAFAQKELAISPAVGAAIGYVAVFGLVFVGVEIAGSILIRLLNVVHMSWVDRLGGGVVGAAVASVIAGLAVLLLTALLAADAPLLRESRLAPEALAYNRMLLAYIPVEVRDAYQLRHDELMRYWLARAQEAAASPTASPGAAGK